MCSGYGCDWSGFSVVMDRGSLQFQNSNYVYSTINSQSKTKQDTEVMKKYFSPGLQVCVWEREAMSQ